MNKQTPKQLKALFCLDHNIKLYIPSTIDIDKKTDTAGHVVECLALFGDLFGGATSYNAKGAWISDQKGLVIEGVKIVESYATGEDIDKHIEAVLKYALKLKKELKQEAISLEYNNKLFLV